MGNKSFEEQFPELWNDGAEVFTGYEHGWNEQQIQKHCLSRQRVKEAIESFENNLLETGIQSKESRVILTRKFDILKDELGLDKEE